MENLRQYMRYMMKKLASIISNLKKTGENLTSILTILKSLKTNPIKQRRKQLIFAKSPAGLKKNFGRTNFPEIIKKTL